MRSMQIVLPLAAASAIVLCAVAPQDASAAATRKSRVYDPFDASSRFDAIGGFTSLRVRNPLLTLLTGGRIAQAAPTTASTTSDLAAPAPSSVSSAPAAATPIVVPTTTVSVPESLSAPLLPSRPPYRPPVRSPYRPAPRGPLIP